MNSVSLFTLSLPLFFFLFLSSINIVLEVEAAPNYLYHVCPNTTLFTSNSTYQNNLKTVLSILSSSSTSATVADAGFSNATSGSAPPDKAYGLFLCRADVSNATCSDCVATATQEIFQRCPNQRVSVIWYDECMLRYSNQSIFSVMEPDPWVILYNVVNVTDPTLFIQLLALLGNAMNESANQASSGILKKAGAAQTTLPSSQNLYVLAQCTPDLSSSDCNACFQVLMGRLPTDKLGARVLMPSCTARFEIYPFYNASALATDPAMVPAPSPSAPVAGPRGKSNNSIVIIIATVFPATLAVVLFFLACYQLRKRARKRYVAFQGERGNEGVTELSVAESLQFDLASIQTATCNFSQDNKLGQGGFGEVFRGTLNNGQEIAVKRLSQSVGQGVEEFKNEVVLVAKLQHRNLVRLLGFCLEGQEKLLIYEFVPNRSLDYFLFDPHNCRELDWSRRYKIIVGVARGMLYLHEDSRLRIIHRDLKASNILLESDMNPKISDFGTARIFGVEQSQAYTGKIVGTFGYMAPEYVMHGQFSVKSDVYSFGILLLEIVSGKRNGSFYETDGRGSLASYAWKHWRHDTPLEVLDPSIRDSYSRKEVIRCLHIGLLCVQEDPADRPTMASIILMLSSYSVTLQMPKEPAFFLYGMTEPPNSGLESDQSNSKSMPSSINLASTTEVFPR